MFTDHCAEFIVLATHLQILIALAINNSIATLNRVLLKIHKTCMCML